MSLEAPGTRPAPGLPESAITARSEAARVDGRLTDADLLAMYRLMVLSRTLDERVWVLNRQGRAAIAASARGHEGAQVASVWATDPARDHYLIYYRQLTAVLALGVSPRELLLGFLAKQGEPLSGARQFPLHGSLSHVDLFSLSNVVATQIPQAAGVALADKMRGESRVTLVYFGDGAASMGDCHEGMNFAGVHRLPVVFFCENNRYAISVPLEKQMAIDHVAARAAGYGFPGVTVAGDDPVAVFEAVRAAADRARSGSGPTLVEAMVERFLPHTTDDDHTRYRSAENIAAMEQRDPLLRSEDILRQRGVLDDAVKECVLDESRRLVNAATEEAEEAGFPDAGTIYDHLTAADENA